MGNNFKLEKLTIVEEIANGSYGRVCKGTYDGEFVAVKELHDVIKSNENILSFKMEIENLKYLNDINVIKYIGASYDKGYPLLVMEYCPLSLSELINEVLVVPPQLILKFTKELVCGLEAIHKAKMVHRDLKPANLLLALDLTLKIADLGLAVGYGFFSNKTQPEGTPHYLAPELKRQRRLNPNSKIEPNTQGDVFSTGLIVYEMFKLQDFKWKTDDEVELPDLNKIDDNWKQFILAATHRIPTKRMLNNAKKLSLPVVIDGWKAIDSWSTLKIVEKFNKSLRTEYDKLNKDNQLLTQQNTILEVIIQGLNFTKQDLEQKINKLSKEKSDLTQQKNNLEGMIQGLKFTKQDLEQKKNELSKETSDLTQQNSTLEGTIEELKQELKILRKTKGDINRLTEQNMKMKMVIVFGGFVAACFTIYLNFKNH